MRFPVFLFLLFSVVSWAQQPVIQLSVIVNDEDAGKRMAGATLEILQDGKHFKTVHSAANGKFPNTGLSLQHVYRIFIKKEGYVTKMAEINAHTKFPEDLAPVLYRDMEVSIFRMIPGVDFSFLDTTPMAVFEISESGYVEHDVTYTKGMLLQIEKLKQTRTFFRTQPRELLRKEKRTDYHKKQSGRPRTIDFDQPDNQPQPSPCDKTVEKRGKSTK